MAYERRPNNGTFWPCREGSKADMRCQINIEGIDYVLFGYKKRVNVRGTPTNIMEVSAIRDTGVQSSPQQQQTSPQQEKDFPF